MRKLKQMILILLTAVILLMAAGTLADSSSYVSDRISENYTSVSRNMMLPVYRGDEIPVETGSIEIGYGEKTELTVNVPEDGLYFLRFGYTSTDSSVLPVRLSLRTDGMTPYYECRNLTFESTWIRNTGLMLDRYGDEMVTVPVKENKTEEKYLSDASGRHSRPLCLALTTGEHVFELTCTEGTVRLDSLTLTAPFDIPEHQTPEAAPGDGMIILEGEAFTYTNDSSVHAALEYDTAVNPWMTGDTRLNILDPDSFDTAGQSVTWKFTVPESGSWQLAVNYLQSFKMNFPVFADILVDGEIPDTAFEAYPFDYGASWQQKKLTDADAHPLSVYLEAGEHTLTLRISAEPLRDVLEALDSVMYAVNDLSLEITKVAGTNSDKYRDLSLSRYIPGLSEILTGYAEQLETLEQQYVPLGTGKDHTTILSGLLVAARQLRSLAENPDEIPYRIAELSTGSSSVNQCLANAVDNLLENSLGIDRIILCQEETVLPEAPGLIESAGMNAGRFFSSFTDQSWSASGADRSHLQVWVNRSSQYVQIMQKMIDEYFTPKTGILVDLSIMPDQYKLVLANSSGNAPDVATGINYTVPYELAIRGALQDMTAFDGFTETASVYEPGFFLTGTIGDGIYSMPETMNFWVLFTRTDVMEKLGLEIPETMDDVIGMLPELQMRGLNFYYATAGMTSMRNFHGTTPLLVQNGGALYHATAAEGTALGTRESVAGLTALTDLFTIYNLPVNVDNFYQHFRNGDLPIGIADFGAYNLIRNAAPELDGSWKISLIPGTVQPDGTIDRTTCGCADSTVIFNSTEEREQMAWEFVRWWSSTEVQAEFGRTVQVTYGDEYLWATANLEAFAQLPWETADKQVILEAARNVIDVARVPGTYMLEREISNAFNDITVNGANEQTRIDKAVKTINREIRRKLEEFGFLDASGNVTEEYRIPTVESVRILLERDSGEGRQGDAE